MVDFIEEHRATFGVEPICRVLPIAPATYYEHRKRRLDPSHRPRRAIRDEALRAQIRRVWEASFGGVYGARKVWQVLRRQGVQVARCTVERLMREMGLRGVVRGRRRRRPGPRAERRGSCADLVRRNFEVAGPNRLWVADLTYVGLRKGSAWVSFVVDAFSRRVVGWGVSRSANASLVLKALEQALSSRPDHAGVVHHSDRGSQYRSVRYTKRIEEAGARPSVGRVGDAYDNALCESVIGLYKTELIERLGPWDTVEAVELATLDWVHWFNHERVFARLGYRTPAEYEDLYHRQQRQPLSSTEPAGRCQLTL